MDLFFFFFLVLVVVNSCNKCDMKYLIKFYFMSSFKQNLFIMEFVCLLFIDLEILKI